MKYYLVAGEASGDLHASNLMQSICERDKDAQFRYIGGDRMQHIGGSLFIHYRRLAFMGFIPVLMHLPQILRSLKLCQKDILRFDPDVVILIDYPGFNLKLARFLKQHTHLRVCYYIAPKVWAWKAYRNKALRRNVDALYSILPFEIAYFKQHGVEATYVGNPSVQSVQQYLATEPQPLRSMKPVIALLPGSRRQEIRDNLPRMLAAAAPFATDYSLVIARAPGIEASFYEPFAQNYPNIAWQSDTYRLLHSAQAALVTSGTATLEAALFNLPQIVCYYIPFDPIVRYLRKWFLHVEWISLVNIIARREVVKELVGADMNVKTLQHELQKLLTDTAYQQSIKKGYAQIRQELGSTLASDTAAESIINTLQHTEKTSPTAAMV